MNSIEHDVNNIIRSVVKRNSAELDMALIKPLSNDYMFSTNGLYIFCGKMGSGKTLRFAYVAYGSPRRFSSHPLKPQLLMLG